MTQHWNDIGDSDCIMVIGGNPAENHPISFRHVQRAIDAGAKLISVDPRYTRTSSKAHYYAPMRSGTDIAFINGMINYVLGLGPSANPNTPGYQEKYVMHYANVGFVLRNDFAKPGDPTQDGLFSGYSWPGSSPGKYSTTSWGYATYPGRTAYVAAPVLVTEGDPANVSTPGGATLTAMGPETWMSGPNPVQVGDTITLPGYPGPMGPGPHPVTLVPNDLVIELGTITAPAGPIPNPVTHYPVQPANAFLGTDIVQDFFDGAGNCTCGFACGFTSSNLTLDGTNGLANYRQHLMDPKGDGTVPSMLPPNAGLTAWEHIKQHYTRYDLNTVSDITGCPVPTLQAVYGEYAKTGVPEKSGTIMYAMGTTQHTHGTQNIRAYASLQLMLGNTGLRGGGINACRGESNVQGSTDHCLLFHILPGYLKQPDENIAGDASFDLTDTGLGPGGHPNQADSYMKRCTPWANHKPPGSVETNWWANYKKYMVSLLKCYWGAKATSGNDFRYDWVPKLPALYAGNCSHISIFEKMDVGKIKGLLCFGQNPAVGGPNSRLARKALRNLEWLVVTDLWETETASFWQVDEQGDPLDAGGMNAINTEVFLLPAACHLEKDGSVVNSSRWTQFRYAAVPPPGGDLPASGAKHEIEILNDLYDNLRPGADPTDAHRDAPIYNLCMGTWWYGTNNPTADFLDREINGWAINAFSTYAANDLLNSFGHLQNNGDTACGNWLYCGSYGHVLGPPNNGVLGNPTGPPPVNNLNKATKRDRTPGIAATYSNWAWSWPVNRRIIYNGASLVPNVKGQVTGASWDSAQPVLVWNPGPPAGWTGDVNDGVKAPNTDTRGVFIMKPDGHGHIHGTGTKDGSYPEHYEPLENPFAVPDIKGRGPNPMGHMQLVNPAAKIWRPAEIGSLGSYPIVATTYRVTEHWQAGAQTRNLPWLVELVPNVFCEISQELAASKGIKYGNWVTITAARDGGAAKVHARAVVTDRFKPFQINGNTVHQIGLIWHFGHKGLGKGHSGNILTPHVGCANTMIPEYKAFRCQLAKGKV